MATATAGETPISTLASDNTVRVTPDTNLMQVARRLVDSDVGVVVVGEDDRAVVGVVSERDLVRALAAGRDTQSTTASDVASTDIAWCDVTAAVAEVAEEMMERYVRHVLVEDKGRLIGIVSARDLLGTYAAADMAAAE